MQSVLGALVCLCYLVLGVLVLPRHWHRTDFAAKDAAQGSGADAHPPVATTSCNVLVNPMINVLVLNYENIILLICDAMIKQ